MPDTKQDMATAATLWASSFSPPDFEPIIRDAARKLDASCVTFESKRHLYFVPPPQVIRMEDIGYTEDTGVSPVAVSQPFQLFSLDAVQHMRSEIFQAEVINNYKFSSNIAAFQLRGYSPKYALILKDRAIWSSSNS